MTFHPSVKKALNDLKKRFGELTIAAFGQTVFWDEPMKSVLVPMLKAYCPNARMIVGPHDADYFGKCPGLRRPERFVTCEHNESATSGIWAAAGEISALFGAEAVPTHAKLAAAGVDFAKIRRMGNRYDQLIERGTTAWGWRGVVESGVGNSVFRDLATEDVSAEVEKLIEWALEGTLSQLENRAAHEQSASELLNTFRESARRPENAALTKVYQSMWPYFYSRLLGYEPDGITVTSTCELFQFNRRTCRLPRFRLVDYFLNPETSLICREAYSSSVKGSGIYALDRFDEGALPFDLVLPGRGRGTMVVRGKELAVDLDPAVVVSLDSPLISTDQLAEVIETQFGPGTSLVGKAIANAFMFTSEFVFALNVHGSAYVTRTRKMARFMADHGIPVKLMPILRLRYKTWDSLEVLDETFCLPEHLAAAWEAPEVTAKSFARDWRSVVERKKALLQTLRTMKSTRELLRLLIQVDGDRWSETLEVYVRAKRKLLALQRGVCAEKQRAHALREEIKSLMEDANRLQYARGQISRLEKSLRRRLLDLKKSRQAESEFHALRSQLDNLAKEELEGIDGKLVSIRRKILELKAERAKTVASYRSRELGPEAMEAKKSIIAAEAETQAAKFTLVEKAIRVVEGLPYTDHRPTAWWLPVVDPKGEWFRAILESTELEIEEMV